MSPRTGRPPSDNPKTTRIEIRVTKDDKKRIMDFAKEHNITLLELLNAGIEAVKQK